MRSTIAAATFAALAAGTLGVGALDNVPNLTGSDTLKAITLDVLIECGANCTGVAYIGTGSSAGQTNLVNGTQSIAPMSRALNSGLCTNASRTNAEGVVFSLDGVNVVGNEAKVCNSAAGGIDYPGTAGVATNDWRNALRTIYAGMPTNQNNILLRDCNSAARRALIASWDNIFKGDCSGSACAADTHPSENGASPATRYDRFNTVVEPGLCHAFRRDEESGTTDVFLGLLNLVTIGFQQSGPSGTTPALTVAQNNAFKALSNSSFCNARRMTDTYPPVTVPSWTQPDGTVLSNTAATAAIVADQAEVIPETVSLGVVPAPASGPAFLGWDHDNSGASAVQWHVLTSDVYYPEFQDQDPVRRKCVGTNATSSPTLGAEQVCSADAHLGVVLPINPPPVAATIAYPTATCNGFEFGPAVVRPNQQPVRCPDGSQAIGSPALCLVPIVSATGSCECLNRGGAWGDNPGPGTPLYTPGGAPPFTISEIEGYTEARTDIDGRVYNLALRDAACNVRTIPRPDPAAATNPSIQALMVGSYYRIHSSRTLLAAPNALAFNCQKTDATRQLGCLVQASPCSFAFAGGQAVEDNPDLSPGNGLADATVGLHVNGVLPNTTNIQNLVTGGLPVYPFARKLYVNTLRGFHNPIDEGGLPDRETELVKAFVVETATGGGSIPEDFGFVSLPGGGAAFCEDFNENGNCPTQECTTVAGRITCTDANTNACAAGANSVAGIPDSAAFCGNGIPEAGEECDDGNLVTDPAVGDATNDTCSNLCLITP